MDLTNPFLLVTPTLDGPVLAALLTVEHLESGAEIHRRAGAGSAHGVRKVLRRLVDQGIAEEVDYGNAKFYRFNRRHAAYETIVALGKVRSVLAERISDDLAQIRALMHASLLPFTSSSTSVQILLIAEGAGDLATPMPAYQLGELRKRVEIWTGNRADLQSLGRAEFDELVARRDPIVMEWRRTNTHLIGPQIIELMNYASY